MPLQATSGAASYDGFGGGVAVVPNYIEDVFSTYLYTGTGATQTITNGIDTTTYGGLVWIKSRSGTTFHRLTDTARGVTKSLATNDNGGTATETTGLTAFGTTGFTIGADADYNTSAATYVSWTFRKQPKFFDVVTYTGTGTAHAINHNLGSVPGFIIVKCTSVTGSWYCYHRGTNGGVNPQNYGMNLGATVAQLAFINFWNNTAPTATQFTVGDSGGETNDTGVSYIAYLFAHDAGGFGLTGTDNVISCGSFTTDGSGNATVSLGYEPQWVMYKSSSTSGGDWQIFDSMRGLTMGLDSSLSANSSGAETTSIDWLTPSATGFSTVGAVFYASATYIYIAMRRGPMKVPTLGTSVLELQNLDNLSVNTLVSSTVVPDMALHVNNLGGRYVVSRLTGGINTASSSSTSPRRWLLTSDTSAEDTGTTGLYYEMQNASFRLAGNGADPGSSLNLAYFFCRAPGFFDEVCYTGTGVARTVTHNLTVAPELMIIKVRTPTGYAWRVYAAPLGVTQSLRLNTDNASETDTYWNGTAPTSTVFSVNNYGQVNNSGSPIVAYLFATLAGVSKVFSYTGNGSSQTINCGFTAGSRFVMIKRTDSTGDWYVWDSARGIVAGNDPHLSLNNTAAEVTTDDSVDTDNTGFIVNQVAATNVNVSSATYIGLAVA